MSSVLFIIHATAWSDKRRVAKAPIQSLIAHGSVDDIVEVIPSREDIRAARYLEHSGTVLQHDGISPVSLFREHLFAPSALFPRGDAVTLVGGVLNHTGGGCLNVAFGHMVSFLVDQGISCVITIPLDATYGAKGLRPYAEPLEQELVLKDFAWKLLRARANFNLAIDGEELASCGPRADLELVVDTQGL